MIKSNFRGIARALCAGAALLGLAACVYGPPPGPYAYAPQPGYYAPGYYAAPGYGYGYPPVVGSLNLGFGGGYWGGGWGRGWGGGWGRGWGGGRGWR